MSGKVDKLLGKYREKDSSTGAGTGDMTAAVYDPAGIVQQLIGSAIAVTWTAAGSKTDWIDGQLYKITDVGEFIDTIYAYGTIDKFPNSLASDAPGLRSTGFGTVIDNSVAFPDKFVLEVDFDLTAAVGARITRVEHKKKSIFIKNDDTTQILVQLKKAGSNFRAIDTTFTNTDTITPFSMTNVDAVGLTLSLASSLDTFTLIGYAGIGDTITATATGQGIINLNRDSGRTISFGATININYVNCTIGGGKAITIQSSQSGRFWVDNISSFQEVVDTDTYIFVDGGGLKTLDMNLFRHAGRIVFDSVGGVNPTPNIQQIINFNSTVGFEIRFMTNPLTCNATIVSSSYTNRALVPITEITMVSSNDFVILRTDLLGTSLLGISSDQY